ncbi:HisA/HisF-related TIM barrel protein [Streptomyces sp. L7]
MLTSWIGTLADHGQARTPPRRRRPRRPGRPPRPRRDPGPRTSYGSPWRPPSPGSAPAPSRLHLVDLDAAISARDTDNRKLIAEVAGAMDIKVELSGGIRDDDTLARRPRHRLHPR